MKRIMLAGIACVLLPACQSFDKALNSADRAIAVTKTPTAKPITDIAKADNREAVNSINGLEPPGVYEKLRTSLPYDETRQYLVRVVGYRKQFLAFGK